MVMVVGLLGQATCEVKKHFGDEGMHCERTHYLENLRVNERATMK